MLHSAVQACFPPSARCFEPGPCEHKFPKPLMKFSKVLLHGNFSIPLCTLETSCMAARVSLFSALVHPNTDMDGYPSMHMTMLVEGSSNGEEDSSFSHLSLCGLLPSPCWIDWGKSRVSMEPLSWHLCSAKYPLKSSCPEWYSCSPLPLWEQEVHASSSSSWNLLEVSL